MIVDALAGYGLTGQLRDPERSPVEAIDDQHAPIVFLDVSSDLKATTGNRLGVARGGGPARREGDARAPEHGAG